MFFKKLCLIVVLNFLQFTVQDPLIQLPNGLILGRESTTIKNTTYFAFEGIPYAAPPTGTLRFQSPQPPQDWNGILNTTRLEIMCFQTSGDSNTESEDCLYINVFTPKLDEVLPVMVFIYGGGFDDGTSVSYNSPDLFVQEDVILVTFNYRVGIFGFLSTQDSVIPGNNGLKDQQFAIQWVNKNIHLFGGDSTKITIFGQSAGAASVAYHLLNQKSSGLYQAAILQSGSCLSPWAFQRNARKIAFATAAILNSNFETNNSSQDLLEFFQGVETRDLDRAAYLYKAFASTPDNIEISQGYFFSPVVEAENPNAFLTEKMYSLMKSGSFIQVPVLIGIASEESLVFNPISVLFGINMQLYDSNPEWLVPNDMNIIDLSKKVKMGFSIRDMYTQGNPLVSNLGNGIRFSSDTSFTRSIMKYAELYSNFSETYFYVFSYHGPMGFFNIHYDNAESTAHGEDTYYFFCTDLNCDESRYPEADGVTRKRLITLWTNFAKFRNPTPEPSQLLQNVVWPLLNTSSGDFYYLNINETLEIKNHPKITYRGWNELYGSLEYDDFDTY